MIELSASEARRLALAAQGFARARPAKPTLAHIRHVVRTLHMLQLDTVNTLVRAHYLPVFSRLGAYQMSLLDRMLNVTHEIVEATVNRVVCFVPVELEPLLRPDHNGALASWAAVRERIDCEHPGYTATVEREVAERGPLTPGDLSHQGPTNIEWPAPRRRDGRPYAESSFLWGRRRSEGRTVLEGLTAVGRLAVAGRRGFERVYDLRERVIRQDVRDRPVPADARQRMVALASRALGIATFRDLAGYFSVGAAAARDAVRSLLDTGELVPAQVEGWEQPAYVAAGARVPRAIDARALLGPFDSLTWDRQRVRRLFGFEFSFEIYVPAPRRRYGYYVLPFLLGEHLVARVDLKAMRKEKVLAVLGSYAEDGHDPDLIAPALAAELRTMAAWLGLERVEVSRRGPLARALRRVAP